MGTVLFNAVGFLVLISVSYGLKAKSHGWSVKYPEETWPKCVINENLNGNCEKIVECSAAVNLIVRGHHPPICYWEQYHQFPLVCCPSNSDGSFNEILTQVNQDIPHFHPQDAKLECGILNLKSENHTPGLRKTLQNERGDEAPSWPWAARLYNDKEGHHFMQSGILIDNQHVITTAQMIVTGKRFPSFVRFSNNLVVEVSETIVHNEFKPWTRYNDISVLKLKIAITDNDNLRPICLPSTKFELGKLAGVSANIIGNTATERIPMVSHTWCEETYSKFSPLTYPKGISEQFICAGLQLNNESLAGLGDAGGAVMMNQDDKWTAIGMVSLDYKCAKQGFPGVYMNLGYFKDWIEQTISQMKN